MRTILGSLKFQDFFFQSTISGCECSRLDPHKRSLLSKSVQVIIVFSFSFSLSLFFFFFFLSHSFFQSPNLFPILRGTTHKKKKSVVKIARICVVKIAYSDFTTPSNKPMRMCSTRKGKRENEPTMKTKNMWLVHFLFPFSG